MSNDSTVPEDSGISDEIDSSRLDSQKADASSDGSRSGSGASVSPPRSVSQPTGDFLSMPDPSPSELSGSSAARPPASASKSSAASGADVGAPHPPAGSHGEAKTGPQPDLGDRDGSDDGSLGSSQRYEENTGTSQQSTGGDASGQSRDGSSFSPSPRVPGSEVTDAARPVASVPGSSAAPSAAASASESGTMFTLDRVIRFLLGAAAVGAVGWILWYFAGLVVYLVVGGIFAYLLRPMVDRLQGLGLGRVPSILVTFVLLFAVASFAVTSIVPFVANQVRDISQLVSVEAATDVANYIETRVRAVVPIDEGVLVKNTRQIANALVNADLVEGDKVAQTVSSVVSVFTNIVYAVIIIPFITFFLLKDGVQIRRSLLQLVPNRYFEIALAILDKVEANIGRYFRALLVQCTSIAIIASTLLWLVGLDNPIAIGLFTGLANTIPYFGPFLGFLGGSLVGIAQTGTFSLIPGVALAMALTQLADNVLLQPIIFSRAAKAHPLVILFVVLVGAQLGGIVGMLIAIPVATTFKVVGEQVLWSIRNYRILRTG